jgi:hypothetical protein
LASSEPPIPTVSHHSEKPFNRNAVTIFCALKVCFYFDIQWKYSTCRALALGPAVLSKGG